jgi:NAD(P)-dependent dehydrogenase (short-subunit alcohol dehydrogenase family)
MWRARASAAAGEAARRSSCSTSSPITITMPSSLPVVLLTGASRGLGLATATLLLRGTSRLPRAHVVAISRSKPDELAALEKEYSGSSDDSPALLVVQGDVTDAKTNQKAVDGAVEKWGRLDALILNAGVVKFARLADAVSGSAEESTSVR